MSRAAIDLREQARTAAARAADRAAVVVRELHALEEFDAASRLASFVWDDDGDPKMPPELLRALSHAGNFVAGALADGTMTGFSVGFLGRDHEGIHLHSHITGVDPTRQHRAVGFALKQFQRAWSLEHGIDVVRWTTDPLVRRNAFFNLSKLGAVLVEYHEDFYGAMNDGLNAGEESDRVVVRWDLTSDAAIRCSESAALPVVRASGEVVLDDGPVESYANGPVLRAWIPEDIVALRHADPARARAWRLALRRTLGRTLGDGYRAHAMTRDGWYVLTR